MAEPSPSGRSAPNDKLGDAGVAPGASATPDKEPPAEGPQKAEVDEPIGGKLTKDDIKRYVEKHGETFGGCYEIGAGKGQQFVATVTLKITIGPSGSVNDVRVVKSTAKNKKVDECVVNGFKKIQFPKPKDGATSVFTFPMEFKGAVEVQ